MFSDGLKVTNNLDFSLLIEDGALFVGTVWAKQIFPFSVWAVKLSQFLYFPVDLGVLALALRENSIRKIIVKNFLKSINDSETELCAKAERKMLQVIGGDCETAIGGLAVIENNNLKLKAQLFSDSGSNSFEYELTGKDIEALNIGKAVGEKLLSLAGTEFKKKWIS